MKKLLFLIMTFFSFDVLSAEFIIQTKENSYTFQTDIADTPLKQQQGLMFQKEIPDNYGMTFIFENKSILRMWMKNTYLPLDMIFFDENGRITHIHKNAEPFSEEIILSKEPAVGVIEVLGGTTTNKQIKIGDQIFIKP
ncbi:MAG: DUF192 domain-containing protein [Alphaproteobacteria bacterium]|nr:DUF192 domain-containing protein [Alphaproteobacteria bacterium]